MATQPQTCAIGILANRQAMNHEPRIMQNKPNFRKARMKLSFYSTRGYEYEPYLQPPGKQTQSNPISKAKNAAAFG